MVLNTRKDVLRNQAIKMQMKTPNRYYFTPSRMGNRWEWILDRVILEIILAVSQKVKHKLSINPATPHLNIYPRKMEARKTCARIFRAVLFETAQTGHNPNVHQL